MKQPRDPNSLTLSVPECAAELGISPRFAYEAVRRGEIPSLRIGNRVLVPRARLVEWVNNLGQQPHLRRIS